MLYSSTVTLSEPTLIAVGQGNSETEHEVHLRVAEGVSDVVIGGQSDAITFPLLDTDPPFCISLQYKEELWADGTGALHILQEHLSSTPS